MKENENRNVCLRKISMSNLTPTNRLEVILKTAVQAKNHFVCAWHSSQISKNKTEDERCMKGKALDPRCARRWMTFEKPIVLDTTLQQCKWILYYSTVASSTNPVLFSHSVANISWLRHRATNNGKIMGNENEHAFQNLLQIYLIRK